VLIVVLQHQCPRVAMAVAESKKKPARGGLQIRFGSAAEEAVSTLRVQRFGCKASL
jgi:hypothetical protein